MWTAAAVLSGFGLQPAAAAAAKRLVVFAFDQTLDALLRIEDLNGDGDTLDAGEVTRFIDDTIAPELGVENAQGLYAFSRREVLATDNFAPDNVVHLLDADDDGDAFDTGEASVYHDGSLPDGYSLTNPASLTRGADGAFYVYDNNTLDNANPAAVYRLEDLNGSGAVDANQPGEVVLWREFNPAGTTGTAVLEIEFGQYGDLYAFDITSSNTRIIRVESDGSAAADFATAANVFALSSVALSGTIAEMSYDRARDRMLVGGFLGNDVVIVTLRDRNANQIIDQANEIRIVWDEGSSGFSTGSPRDIFWLEDESAIWVDALSDRIWRLFDNNGDGDYLDAGETTYLYDAVAAAGAGQPSATLMLSSVALLHCIADIDEDGLIGLSDLSALLENFGMPSGATALDGDLDGDGDVDLTDLSALLTDFGLSCAM
jgi:hypothetical protein